MTKKVMYITFYSVLHRLFWLFPVTYEYKINYIIDGYVLQRSNKPKIHGLVTNIL